MPFCKKCGAELMEDAKYCPSCGTPVDSFVPPTPTVPRLVSRPGGIAILAFLEGLVSFLMLIGGVALIGLGAFLAAGGWDIIPKEELAKALQNMPLASIFTSVSLMAFTTSLLIGVGMALIILAVLGFIMTWGLWSGRSWARTITMILSILGIVIGIFSLPGSIISILVDIVVLYYLTRPQIRAYYH